MSVLTLTTIIFVFCHKILKIHVPTHVSTGPTTIQSQIGCILSKEQKDNRVDRPLDAASLSLRLSDQC